MKNWFAEHMEWILGGVLVAAVLGMATCAKASPVEVTSFGGVSGTSLAASTKDGAVANKTQASTTYAASVQAEVNMAKVITGTTFAAAQAGSINAAAYQSSTTYRAAVDAAIAEAGVITSTTFAAALSKLLQTAASTASPPIGVSPWVQGMTTGIWHPAMGARENSAGTVYAQAVYPMGNALAAVDSATLLVVSTAIAVCSYVAPTFTAHEVLRNNSDSVTVYVGGSGVTAATGIPIYPHEAFSMDSTTGAGQVWYAITAAGSADLRWARW